MRCLIKMQKQCRCLKFVSCACRTRILRMRKQELSWNSNVTMTAKNNCRIKNTQLNYIIMKPSRVIQASIAIAGAITLFSCKPQTAANVVSGDAVAKTYVAPGKYDEFYNFVSGGFNGQLSVVGLPSGRTIKIIPVFSQDPENGWGYSEETKPMLNTSHGYIPWDDAHHPALSQTNGEVDGRWLFINGNNTPRIARIDL